MIALRSVEEDCTEATTLPCKQRTYAVVFNLADGAVLLEEQLISDEFKFEGIEFVDLL